jgi:hypothetical protein
LIAIDYLQRPAPVLDRTRAFQSSAGKADSGASGTQHLRQELVRERKHGRINPVLAHQQPPRQTLVDLMQPVAGGYLAYL